jgi:PTH2 family peptidyl-tRNA hydrolase
VLWIRYIRRKRKNDYYWVIFMLNLDYKVVIVTRTDLKLRPGKLAVQVAHASVICAVEGRRKKPKWYNKWYNEGQKKVVVSASNLAELKTLERKADKLGLTTALVSDAGLTEVPAGTVTCLGIGPGPNSDIDKITGNLPLL